MQLNIPHFVFNILQTFHQAGYEIYIAGGAVRDILMKKSVKDWDFTTNATPEDILKIFPDGFYDNKFGTVGLVDPEDKHKHHAGELDKVQIYEITTFRKEAGYSDRRHPDKIEWGKTLEDDLQRRDFTINAMALRLVSSSTSSEAEPVVMLNSFQHLREPPAGPESNSGRQDISEFDLIDLYGGHIDLKSGVIRAVGNAKSRFEEDALRILRAVRLAAQLGFIIEPETLQAIQISAELINHIAKERIRDELFKLLATNYPADGIRMLANTGLMEHFLSEMLETQGVDQAGHHTTDVWEHSLQSLQHCPSNDALIRFATLIHDIGKPRTRAFICEKCGMRFGREIPTKKEPFRAGDPSVSRRTGDSARNPNRETASDGDLSRALQGARDGDHNPMQCPNCGFINDYYRSVTFYNHEIVGAKIARRIADRLRLSNAQKDLLITLVRWHMFSVDERQTEKAVRRFVRNVGKENLNDMLALRTGDRLGGGARETSWRLERFKKLLEEVQKQPFTVHDLKIDGEQIMNALGIKPGPEVGSILKQLFAEVEEHKMPNEEEVLLARVHELAHSGGD